MSPESSRRANDILLQEMLDTQRETNRKLDEAVARMASLTTTVDAHKTTLISLDADVTSHDRELSSARGWIKGALALGGVNALIHALRYLLHSPPTGVHN